MNCISDGSISSSHSPSLSNTTSLYSLSNRQCASNSTISTTATSPQPTAKATTSSTNPLVSMKDWFTYVYRIENIEEIIKGHESQQSFIQSPIFQFKSQSNTSTTNKNTTASTTTSQPNSNWRLIFYPNGAGSDCKNFLSIFLKYTSDEPVKIQMMFSIVNNNNEDVYVKYTVNKFNKGNDWGFKQLIHKNAILFQQSKFLRNGALSIRVKMRLDEHKNEYMKKLNDNLHYCKILSENFSQYYETNNDNNECTDANNNNINNNNNVYSGSESDTEHVNVNININANSIEQLTAPQSSSSSGSSSCSTATTITTTANSNSNSNSSSSMANSLFYDCLLVVKSQPIENSNENSLCKISSNSTSCGLRRKSFENQSYPPAKRIHLTPNDENSNSHSSFQKTSVIDDCCSNSSINNSSSNSCISSNNAISGCSGVQSEIHEFRAHKCILAARSPVFKAMFNYRLKENITNKVIIEDCKPEVMKAMLKYLYTAYLPDENLSAIAIDLFIAAEKYYIESLKLKVREYLVENLNNDNVMQTFVLAELYNDSMLRKQSLKYICENIDKVTQHSDWDEYLKMYPQFFTNAFVRLCKKDF